MASLFPHEDEITKENIGDLILQKHTKEIEVQKENFDYQNPLHSRLQMPSAVFAAEDEEEDGLMGMVGNEMVSQIHKVRLQL